MARVLAVQVELVKAPKETIMSETVNRHWWTAAPRVAAFRLRAEMRRERQLALNGARPGRERHHHPAAAGPRRRPATA